MRGCILYWTSNMTFSTPHSKKRSNMLRQYLVFSAFSEKVVAGSCCWSPTNITLRGWCSKGIRLLSSTDWHASSTIKKSMSPIYKWSSFSLTDIAKVVHIIWVCSTIFFSYAILYVFDIDVQLYLLYSSCIRNFDLTWAWYSLNFFIFLAFS